MWNRASLVTIVIVVAVLFSGAAPAHAQNRYDDEDPIEKFNIRVGGFRQDSTESTVRVDSKTLGLGTIITLEDQLAVDSELTVVRVDGFYRFNPKHRLEWTLYESKREGVVTILEDIQLGDTLFVAGETLDTEWRSGILKIGWAWSFINTRKYEFYAGAGLNIRDLDLEINSSLGGTTQQEAEDAAVPLPTFVFGGRFNPGKSLKWSLNWRSEIFSLEVGDFDGRFVDTTFLVEHNTFKHVGFGGGLNSFLFDLEAEDDDFRGEVEIDYIAFLLYVKAYF